MFNGMVLEAGSGGEHAMIQQAIEAMRTPWYEDLMKALNNVWGDWGLVALCVMVVLIAIIFRDVIGVVVKRIFGKG